MRITGHVRVVLSIIHVHITTCMYLYIHVFTPTKIDRPDYALAVPGFIFAMDARTLPSHLPERTPASISCGIQALRLSGTCIWNVTTVLARNCAQRLRCTCFARCLDTTLPLIGKEDTDNPKLARSCRACIKTPEIELPPSQVSTLIIFCSRNAIHRGARSRADETS